MVRLFFFLFILPISIFAQDRITTVESDFAHYDGHELILKGHVVVVNPMGRLAAEEALLERDAEGKSSIDFPWLHLTNDVVIVFSNGGLLRCHKVDLDYHLSIAILKGPPQIYYKDEMGELYADWAQIDYEEQNGKFQPKKVSLRGNVQMIGNSSLNKDKDKPTLQYALADNVDYFPLEERMTLKGDEGRSVLFYDRLKEMQLSAHTVHASRNPIDGKEKVQGMGDVRFVFKQEELEKLKTRFKWE